MSSLSRLLIFVRNYFVVCLPFHVGTACLWPLQEIENGTLLTVLKEIQYMLRMLVTHKICTNLY